MKHQGTNGHDNTTTRTYHAKMINGKVWIARDDLPGGWIELAEDDPRYPATFRFLDNNVRFAEMIRWVYDDRNKKKDKFQNN